MTVGFRVDVLEPFELSSSLGKLLSPRRFLLSPDAQVQGTWV